MSILLAITTYNEIEITEKCIVSALKSDIPIDILIIDDYSEKENIKSLLKKYNVQYIGKISHSGLTPSWNIAYRYFLQNGYEYLFISNNDVLIPIQSIRIMIEEFKKTDCYIVCPSSTKSGAGIGKCGINQGITQLKFHPNIDVNDSKNYQLVQNLMINDTRYHITENLNIFNGFFFGMSKKIKEFQFDDKNLFNTKLINICNEIDLHQRIMKKYPLKILYVPYSFIFHFKAVTIDIRKRDDLTKLENKYKIKN